MTIKLNDIIVKVKYFLIFLYVLLVYIYGGQENSTIIYKIPMVFYIILESINIIRNKRIDFPKNMLILYLFDFFLLLSSFWAINASLSIETAKTVFLLISFYLLIYNFLSKQEDGNIKLLKILLWAGVCFSIYILSYYGFNKFWEMLGNGTRIGREIDNVNRIGLEVSITYLIILYIAMNYSKKYFLLIPVPLIVAFGSGSRKVVLILVLGTMLISLLKSEKKIVSGIVKKMLIISVFIIGLYYIINLLDSLSLIKRFSTFLNMYTGNGKIDDSTLERTLFIKYGWIQFTKTPLIGIGAGNSGYITMKAAGWFTYLHNNYIEILATTGIIGFILYYYNYYFLIKNILRDKGLKTNNNLKNFLIILIVILLLLDYGLVSYNGKPTYIYFLIPLTAIYKENRNEKDL